MRPLVRALLLCGWAPALLTAQVPGGRCSLTFPNFSTTRLRTIDAGNGFRNSFLGGGVFAKCEGQEVTLRSDSAEVYESSGLVYLMGTVKYREPRANLDSRRLTYYINDERLYAEGDVVVTLPSGTVMRGPVVEYFRAVPAVRTVARMYAPQRSRTFLVQKDTSAKGRDKEALDTVIVVADRTTSIADSIVYLGGTVTIDRRDMKATGDSALMDSGREFGQLVHAAKVVGTGARGFTLESLIIDLFSKNRELQRVVAKTEAHAISDDLDLTSDTIVLNIDSSRVIRARAWGKKRALAVSPVRRVLADSLDVQMPRQQVRELHALGLAFAEMEPDTVKLRSAERDWVRGDTIVAYFDTVATADTTSQPKMREMVASGKASSYFQVASRGDPDGAPAINYVRGKQITVAMDSGQARQVTVREQATGIYLEPDSVSAPRGAVPSAGPSAASSAPIKSGTTAVPPASKAPAPKTPAPKTSAPKTPAKPALPAGTTGDLAR